MAMFIPDAAFSVVWFCSYTTHCVQCNWPSQW